MVVGQDMEETVDITDQTLGWIVLIVSGVGWVTFWIVEYKARKKINQEQWRDARVRMGLPKEYRSNIRRAS